MKKVKLAKITPEATNKITGFLKKLSSLPVDKLLKNKFVINISKNPSLQKALSYTGRTFKTVTPFLKTFSKKAGLPMLVASVAGEVIGGVSANIIEKKAEKKAKEEMEESTRNLKEKEKEKQEEMIEKFSGKKDLLKDPEWTRERMVNKVPAFLEMLKKQGQDFAQKGDKEGTRAIIKEMQLIQQDPEKSKYIPKDFFGKENDEDVDIDKVLKDLTAY